MKLFLIKEQTAVWDCYRYDYFLHDQQMRPSKENLYHVVTSVPCYKYVLNILVTFLAKKLVNPIQDRLFGVAQG